MQSNHSVTSQNAQKDAVKKKSSGVQLKSSVIVKPDYSLPEIEMCSTPQFDSTVSPIISSNDVSTIGRSHVFDINIMDKINNEDEDEVLQGIDLQKYLAIPTESFPLKCRPHHRESLPSKNKLSPVNLDNSAVLAKFVNLSFDGYSVLPSSMKIVESKDSVKLNIDYGTHERPSIYGGPLHHRYILEEIEFHCGADNLGGSEHTYFSHAFVMEMQVIHRREDLRLDHALKQNDGIAIISYFFVLDNEDNPCLQNILSKTSDIKSHIPVFPLDHLIQMQEKNYFTYSGSLTAPPHNECVTWLIMTVGIGISQAQLDNFKEIAKSSGHTENIHKRTYGLNGRSLFFATDI